MQRTLARSSFVLVLLLAACPSIQMQDWEETRVYTMNVNVTLPDLPEGQVRLWMPAPITVPGLELRSPLAVTATGAEFAEKSDDLGNRYLFVESTSGKSRRITISYEVDLACSRVPPPPEDGSTGGLWESKELDLGGDPAVLTRIRKQALFVTAQQPTWFGKARALAGWLKSGFRPGPDQGLALSFEKMRGSALDMNRLYVVACQTLGIPARIEAGFALPSGDGKLALDEVLLWTSIRVPGMDWIPVDLRDAQLTPEGWEERFGGLAPARIRLVSGEGARLDPGFAEGGQSLFLRPHVEIEGKRWTGMQMSMTVDQVPKGED